MKTILDRIIAGEDLIAFPPTVPAGSWHYKIGGQPVIVRTEDMLAILRSSQVSGQRLAGDKIRYYHTTIQQRKLSRREKRLAREAKK